MDFDLQINNYTLNDVKRLFKLTTNYTKADVNLKEYKLREQLLQSGHIDKRFQQDLVGFLDDAKRWLIDQLPEGPPPFTSIPKNLVIDPYPDVPHMADPISRESELIIRPTTNFIYSQPSEIFPGIVNPLDRRILTKILNVDTKFRQNYNTSPSTDFNFNLPEKFGKVVSMQLASIELPITYYNISKRYGNNFLYIATRDESTYIDKVFTIPDGNYTNISLINTLNSLLSEDPDSLFAYIQFSLDMADDGSGSGLVTVDTLSREPPLLFVNFDFTRNINGQVDALPVNQKIGYVLGFIQCAYLGSVTYTGESPMYVDTMPYVFLSIDDYNNNVNNGFSSAFSNSILNSNILARVSTGNRITDFTKTLIADHEILVSVPRTYFGPVNILKMHIRLFDEYGRIFDLNRRDFSFCLNFKVLYDL